MREGDFKYLNVPALLARKAWATSADGELVEDLQWPKRLSERLFTLVRFFRENGLLESQPDPDISRLVLYFFDFTEQGRRFIRSGAPDKWLASFDKDPSKSSDDDSYLVRSLRRLKP
jgi:hypothetical protein